MPTPTLTEQAAREAVLTMQQALETDESLSAAARRIGIDRNTLRHRLSRAEELYGYTLESKLAPIAPKKDSIDQMPDRGQALMDTVNDLRLQLRDARREAGAAHALRAAAFGLAESGIRPAPDWPELNAMLASNASGQASSGDSDKEVPVLFTSDFQFGEVIRPEEVDGLNAFDVEIAVQRYRELITKTIDICFNHTRNPDYPGIYYLRGGDAISGSIHDELAETDELTPPASIKRLASEEIAGIERLAEAFGRVHVVSIPGNHGRTTHKPRAKHYVALNYEDLLTWFIEAHFAHDSRVTFHTPISGDAYFSIGNLRFLLTHGDRIGSRGGTGFIGPAATILRGLHKTRQQYAQIGKPVDYMLVGHYHTPMMLQHVIVNGSLSGFGEYARQLRVEPDAASQWLFFVHPQVGISQTRQLYVSRLGDFSNGDSTPRW